MNKQKAINMFGIAPDGSNPVCYFETEMGSKYILTNSGMSRRIKFDGTIHEWHDRCVFIPNYDIYSQFDTAIRMCLSKHVRMWFGNRNDSILIGIVNGDRIVTLNNLNQIDRSVSGRIEKYHFETTPLIGANVFEFDKRQDKSVKRFHPGHSVTMAVKLL